MGVEVTVAPADEPLTLQEALDHLRLDTTDDVSLVERHIRAAREHYELRTGRSLVTRTLRWTMDGFSPVIVLPQGPVSSVTSIQYLTAATTWTTLSASLYAADLSNQHEPRVMPAYGQVWPIPIEQPANVRVTYVAGYGSRLAVPADVRAALLLLVGHLHENREAVTGSMSALPLGFESLSGLRRQMRV